MPSAQTARRMGVNRLSMLLPPLCGPLGLLGFGPLYASALLFHVALLALRRLRLDHRLRRRREVPDAVERDARRGREDRRGAGYPLTAGPGTRGRDDRREAIDPRVVQVEVFAFVLRHEFGARDDEHVVPIRARVGEVRFGGARTAREQVDATRARFTRPRAGAL